MSFWVEEDLQLLLDKLMEETGAGRIHFTWKNDNIFHTIAAHLLNRTGKPYTTEMVDIEYYRLHGRYWIWEQALKSKFVKWDPVTNKLLVRDESLWDILVKDAKTRIWARKYRDNGERYWVELTAIFGRVKPPNVGEAPRSDDELDD